MRRLVLLVFLAIVPLGWLGPVAASEPPSPVDQYKEEVKRSQLGPAIGVDQGTVDKLLEIDRRYKPLKTQLNEEMRSEFARLQHLLSQPAPAEPEVQDILQSMIQKRQEKLNLEQKQLEEEMAVLTPVQQGRYLLFLMGLRKKMVKEAYNLRSLPASPRPPASTLREIPVVQPSR
ncbi:MAG: hypothetical protein A2Y80_02585 [Deltaproteobacteria bacterium RBG_13_58_19]|nr:MAG: hypothetical protein A2Y80_02585 [Deltaproteobacteria bacterium RBG_13_58_19]